VKVKRYIVSDHQVHVRSGEFRPGPDGDLYLVYEGGGFAHAKFVFRDANAAIDQALENYKKKLIKDLGAKYMPKSPTERRRLRDGELATMTPKAKDDDLKGLEAERHVLCDGIGALQSTDSPEGVPMHDELQDRLRDVETRLKKLDPNWLPPHQRKK
jgi:hypothetical protein